MADNTTLNAGSGGDTFASDDISGVKYPRSKIVIGADGTNDGDVASGNPLPVLLRSEFVDDAAFTPATSRLTVFGAQADETSPDSVDEGDAGALRMTLDRQLRVVNAPHTNGGLLSYVSYDLDEGQCEQVKGSAGQVYGAWITNVTTETRWVKFYNTTAGTVGTDTPVAVFGVPGNSTDDVSAVLSAGGHGLAFSSGISIGASTGPAANNTGAPAANDVVITVFYK